VNSIDRAIYEIVIYTARDEYFRDVTERWLKRCGVNYDRVHFNKLFYHTILDDCSANNIKDLEKLL